MRDALHNAGSLPTRWRLPELDLVALLVPTPSELPVLVLHGFIVDPNPLASELAEEAVEVIDSVVDHPLIG